MGNMKSPRSTGKFRPFEALKELLEKRAYTLKQNSADSPDEPADSGGNSETDGNIFKEAMKGVKKISRNNCAAQRVGPKTAPPSQNDGEN